MNKFEEARRKADLTLVEASKLLEINKMTLSRYENGKTFPNTKIIEKMTEVYKKPSDYFFYN